MTDMTDWPMWAHWLTGGSAVAGIATALAKVFNWAIFQRFDKAMGQQNEVLAAIQADVKRGNDAIVNLAGRVAELEGRFKERDHWLRTSA